MFDQFREGERVKINLGKWKGKTGIIKRVINSTCYLVTVDGEDMALDALEGEIKKIREDDLYSKTKQCFTGTKYLTG